MFVKKKRIIILKINNKYFNCLNRLNLKKNKSKMPKGSAAKLKNMTDEERVLYMEQKMLLEAEAKKKKEDLLNELLKVNNTYYLLLACI